MAFDTRAWRVGSHYGIHVYAVTEIGEDDEPILTASGDLETAQQLARQVVREHNAARG